MTQIILRSLRMKYLGTSAFPYSFGKSIYFLKGCETNWFLIRYHILLVWHLGNCWLLTSIQREGRNQRCYREMIILDCPRTFKSILEWVRNDGRLFALLTQTLFKSWAKNFWNVLPDTPHTSKIIKPFCYLSKWCNASDPDSDPKST